MKTFLKPVRVKDLEEWLADVEAALCRSVPSES